MNKPHLTWETALYGLALVLALTLRLLNLGQAPLSESEAAWAVDALNLARPSESSVADGAALGAQPLYVLPTAALFSLVGASDSAARLLPALAGALLALLPWLLRRHMGRMAALVMAFGLALDPALATLSRQAGGPMLAVACTAFALAFWLNRKPLWAGIFAGLAALGGPMVLFGLLAGLCAWVMWWWRTRRSQRRAAAEDVIQPEAVLEAEATPSRAAYPWRVAVLAALGIFILLGTLLLRAPQGLAAAFSALPLFIDGWITPTGQNLPGVATLPLTLLLIVIAYGLYPLSFALIAAGRRLEAWIAQSQATYPPANQPDADPESYNPEAALPVRAETETPAPAMLGLALLLAAAGLLLALLYPARQPAHLAWVFVALWAAAGVGLAPYLPTPQRLTGMTVLHAGLSFVLAAMLFVWMSRANTLLPLESEDFMTLLVRPALLVGILALLALTTALVALSFTWPVGRNGLVWGLSVAWGVYTLAALSNAAYLSPNQPQNLLAPAPGPGQTQLLMQSVRDISIRTRGFGNQMQVLSLIDHPSLRWALRDYPFARFTSQLPAEEQPGLVITAGGASGSSEMAQLSSSYRGQDFVWWQYPAWPGALPPDLSSWLFYRQAPLVSEHIILWARADLFPGAVKLAPIP